jgi:hypothetical protein
MITIAFTTITVAFFASIVTALAASVIAVGSVG